MGNISLETCKSYKQTHAFALVCFPNLQLSVEIFPVFYTKDGLISILKDLSQWSPVLSKQRVLSKCVISSKKGQIH